MRRIICIVCAAALLFSLSSCGQPRAAVPEEPITLFPAHSETQSADDPLEEITASAQPSLVNKTYGQTKIEESFGTVKDVSPIFRTEDSYAYEPDALAAAKSFFASTISMPETLTVSDVQVFDCADDGDNVYYCMYLQAAYRVETGEEIRRSSFLNIGICKEDRSAFDATADMRTVMQAYSVFSDAVLQMTVTGEDYAQAAQTIALAQLKKPEQGRLVQAYRRDDLCDDTQYEAFDVVCAGINAYDMEILGVYTVYMRSDNGVIRQLDSTQI